MFDNFVVFDNKIIDTLFITNNCLTFILFVYLWKLYLIKLINKNY